MKKNLSQTTTRHQIIGGFSLLEILLAISILSIMSLITASSYVNYIKYAEFDSFSKKMLFDTREVRANAMSGKDGKKWGVHAVNGVSDYYEIFSTDTDYAGGTVDVSVFLPAMVSFNTPSEGNTADIIFSKASGTTTATTLVLVSRDATTTIAFSAEGLIF